ncbi:MAG TPA: apolipoprotein N-acyltransferase [Gammaproteobacteria bacterium]|nr:apolipoprotein N-acyltransferase [Gammaproteobacteria bacterium]
MSRVISSQFIPFLIAFIAGAILPMAFAPVGFEGLAILSPVVLLFLLDNISPKQALLRGLVYGLGFFGFGAYWIYISIDTYGNTNFIIAGIITAGFIGILAMFPAVMCYVYKKYINAFFGFACLWVIFEWIRSWFFTGFPWLLLGQSQTNNLFLKGYAPIVGVYGLSFLTVFTASLFYNLCKNNKKILSGILFVLIWSAGYCLNYIQWTHPISEPFPITLIQGNIPEMTKWDPHQAYKSLKTYEALSAQHLDSKMIIWPEAAITMLNVDAKPFLEDLNKTAEQHKTAIITGIPIYKNNKYYNGAIVVGDGHGEYLKRHLVPFGEYVPLEKYLRGLIGFFNLPMSSFTPGPQVQHLLSVQGMSVAPFICYEIAYSHLLRTDLPRAEILVTMSNDSWFDQSEALAQHRQIAQLSAEMTQRYMLVATNSGKTAVIDPFGNIVASAPENQPAFITSSVQAMGGTTPWITFGNWPILILMLIGLFL